MTRYIDVEEAKKFFDEMDAGSRERGGTLLTANEFSEYLDEIPTADVQKVKHGHWILRGGWNRCSVCDSKALLKDAGGIGGLHEYDQVKSDICPYCGARMNGKE